MLYVLFTEDLGMIHATAQGIRFEKSKLRHGLQKYFFSNVCLVKGREYWRLTSAEKLISVFDRRINLSTRKLVINVLEFVRRMVSGEVKQKELFEILSDVSSFCFANAKLINGGNDKSLADKILTLAKYKILESLGYGMNDTHYIDMYFSKNLSLEQLTSLDSKRAGFVVNDLEIMKKHIDTALLQSHL